MIAPAEHDCALCAFRYIEQDAGLCEVFGIDNPRLVITGFVLYDPTTQSDVRDLDSCKRADCPGKV